MCYNFFMNLFSKKRKENEERILVIDIGSGSVGIAMVTMKIDYALDKKTPRIYFSTRSEIASKNNKNFDLYVENMLKSLNSALKKVHNASIGMPNRIQVVLSAPWYASQTRTIEYSRNSQFTFSKKLWYDLLLREVKLFEDDVARKFSTLNESPKIIEKKNMEVRLNGYHTNDPIGKKTSQVEMPVYMSMAPEHLMNAIEKVISKYYRNTVHWNTYLFASYVVARDLFFSEKTYLLINIGGEVTDIGYVKNEILVESFSFPIGKNSIIRSLIEHLAVSWDEASSLLHMYDQKMLSGRHKDNVGLVIERLLAGWTGSLEKAIVHMTHDFTVPETIFATMDNDVKEYFIDAIHKESFTQFTSGSRRFNVIVIDASALHEYCALENLDEKDHSLMIDAMYSARQFYNTTNEQ